MKPGIAYLDDYFNHALLPEEKKVFEERCATDEDFAEEVASYLAARGSIQYQLDKEKKQRWKHLREQQRQATDTVPGILHISAKKWLMLAAACVAAIIFTLWVIEKRSQNRVNHYITYNLKSLGVSMSADTGDLEQGISSYNGGDYNKAILIFSALAEKDPPDVYALQYRGLSYLMRKDYDLAIRDFTSLANYELVSNPGLFYKAIAILQRDRPGDRNHAREILQKVVAQKLEGYTVAADWLNHTSF